MNQQKDGFRLLPHILLSRPWWRLLLLLTALASACAGLLVPFFQKLFVDSLQGQKLIFETAPTNYLWLGFAASVAAQFFGVLTTFIGTRESIFLQKKLGEKLYSKMLSIRRDNLTHRPLGEIVAIYATDIPAATTLLEQTLPMGLAVFFPLILAPLFLTQLLDFSIWPVALTMTIVLVFHVILSARQARFFQTFKRLAAERVGLVNEWIQNIRTLRILGWTENFEKRIFSKREEETLNRVRMVGNGQTNSAIAASASFLINLVAASTLIYLDHKTPSSGELLSIFWVFGVFLTRPFRSMPALFTFALDSTTSITRLQEFFSYEGNTLKEWVSQPNIESNSEKPATEKVALAPLAPLPLRIEGLDLTIGTRKILNKISIAIPAGEFLCIVGEVGSGKSQLLQSLMRETAASFKSFQYGHTNLLELPDRDVRQLFCYVSQEGFTMSSTLRDNIALHYESSATQDQEMKNCLAASQLDLGREFSPAGLDTEIGERGVNLSGGQRQRLNIARAAYFDRPVLLLDDSLSALDVETESAIIEKLFQGRWREKTRILATHRLSILKQADRIVFLKNGSIKALGSWQQLWNQDSQFREFTRSVSETKATHPEIGATVE